MNRKERALAVLDALTTEYPERRPLLSYKSAFELLIAVILSAQTTDGQVNLVTPELFHRYRNPNELARASVDDIASLVHSVGFFRTKARNIHGTAVALVQQHNGRVPDTMEDLLKLPGVGRKSANVILSHIYGMPAIIVDTHFSRVTRRIGLTIEKEPARIEWDIASFLPEIVRTDFSMAVNYHGRYCCTAKLPECYRCVAADLCDFTPKRTA